MTPVEKALIVPQCEQGVFCLFSLTFPYFTSLPFLCGLGCEGGQGGKEVNLNRLMCSIQRTLYTSSIKQESALYAAGIVPLRAAKKASHMLPRRKKIALSSTPEESGGE